MAKIKRRQTGKTASGTGGVRLYSSTDLYNWKDEGIIIPPEKDEHSPLHPSAAPYHLQQNDEEICLLAEKS